jgi:S-(hydroxymethyl)glutathione dehydrogenase/alcohol dehydrogenase
VAEVAWGEQVAVIGCGAVGLGAIQGARLAGAGRIIAVDVTRAKLDLALEVGATDLIEAGDDAAQRIRDLTGGRGADVVVEAAGRPAAFRLSVEAARAGGRIVWLGKTGVDEEVAFRWGSLMGERQIRRSSYGGARPHRDFPEMAAAYLAGDLKLDPLISRRIRLDEINDAFDALRLGEVVRTVIQFDT